MRTSAVRWSMLYERPGLAPETKSILAGIILIIDIHMYHIAEGYSAETRRTRAVGRSFVQLTHSGFFPISHLLPLLGIQASFQKDGGSVERSCGRRGHRIHRSLGGVRYVSRQLATRSRSSSARSCPCVGKDEASANSPSAILGFRPRNVTIEEVHPLLLTRGMQHQFMLSCAGRNSTLYVP